MEILEVLLVLNLRDVNLDAEKEQEVKNKKLQAKKGRILQLSKKERKVCDLPGTCCHSSNQNMGK